jgi:signal transduction histidine kinase
VGFNALIAFMLMEMNVFEALGDVLGLFANIAIAWMMAVVADLVINKPLGLSPPGIEFKRAHLWDINPVGVGAMALASLLSITAHLGVFGPLAQAFSALIALGTALVVSPLIAWATGGKYYLARGSVGNGAVAFAPAEGPRAVRWARVENEVDEHGADGSYQRLKVQHCVICEREYEGPDMAHCPAYQGAICSLCCTLDARCGDLCKPHASLSAQWSSALRWLLPRLSWRYLDTGLGHFLLLMLIIVPVLAVVFGVLYQQELRALGESALQLASQSELAEALAGVQRSSLRSGFLKAYMALLVIAGVVAWWLVLAHQSRKVAQEESNRQTHLLMREIELHRATDRALQSAKQTAEEAREVAEQAKLAAEEARRAADQANQAKSRYISAISHELRTPLNSILGYAQLMGEDASVPPHRQQAVAVIKRGGEHLLSLIEGTLAIAHIEAGKLTLHARPMRFADTLRELADMFELQAAEKGLRFRFETTGALPAVVRSDEKRVCQILINLLGNAIKFTTAGEVTLRLSYAREFASVEIEDTGPGMTAEDIERIFEPFTRGDAAAAATPGAGLGLTIAKMLTDLMGGEMKVSSTPGEGSLFCVRLFLPRVHETAGALGRAAPAQRARRGYEGRRRQLLVVDNEEADRDLLGHVLAPLGCGSTSSRPATGRMRCSSTWPCRASTAGRRSAVRASWAWSMRRWPSFRPMPSTRGWTTTWALRPRISSSSRCGTRSCSIGSSGGSACNGRTRPRSRCPPRRATASRPCPSIAGRAAAPRAVQAPSLSRLRTLDEAVSLGYFRGIMNQLDEIDAEEPECRAWTEAQRVLARQFQFEAMGRALAAAVSAA